MLVRTDARVAKGAGEAAGPGPRLSSGKARWTRQRLLGSKRKRRGSHALNSSWIKDFPA